MGKGRKVAEKGSESGRVRLRKWQGKGQRKIRKLQGRVRELPREGFPERFWLSMKFINDSIPSKQIGYISIVCF